ncbi:MAG: peptidase S10 [Candidatus Aminicenantes bacterium 4484_214]|nr:MAG: peptidase S10 [Candidatus Aminicenantes bacterium 4484_214]RLE10760.1 MAG: peptidase S10 [Candidatus Aminicenantes bacterium]
MTPPLGAEEKPARNFLNLKEDIVSVTHHTIKINNQVIPYTATAGYLTLRDEEGKGKANVFFTAYTREDIKDLSHRPLTFAFNGGPGSSTVWLHLGALGPKKVLLDDNGFPLPPPFKLIDNPYTLLDVSDIVCLDAISTGFSRALPGEKPQQFHGVREDIEAVGEFIRLYLTRNNRWLSPKFILGESYGTTRATGLAGYLQGRRFGLYLNGVILVSSVLDFSTLDFSPGNDLAYILFLPTYTATAWYHHRLPNDLQTKSLREVLDEAEKLALNEYSLALLKGNSLSAEEKEVIIKKISRFTGLSSSYLAQANLRVSAYRFFKELLRNKHLTVGRLDSRFTGRDADAAGERPDFDPSSTAITGPFATLINHYLRVDLKFPNDLTYAIYGNVRPWRWIYEQQDRTPNVYLAETMRQALNQNKFLKVFVANGYYDLATPYFATEYTFNHIGLNGEFKDRVKMGFYEAGHMMYIHKKSHAQLKKDLAEFIKWAKSK